MATAFPYENATSGAAAREEITRLLRRSLDGVEHNGMPDMRRAGISFKGVWK